MPQKSHQLYVTWKNAVSAKTKCGTAKIEKITRIISDISQNKPDA